MLAAALALVAAGPALVPADPPPRTVEGVQAAGDVVAPVLTATIPATARIGPLRVPVTCSEPCDVRVQIKTSEEFPPLDAEAVRAVASSATVTVRPLEFVLDFWRRRPPSSLRIEVLASDRAGTVAQVVGTARFQRR